MIKCFLYILLLSAISFSQSGSDYICNSKVKDTCFVRLANNLNKSYAVVEVDANDDNLQIGNNIRNVIIERIMELGRFEKVYLSIPVAHKKDCIVIKTQIADLKTSKALNGFAVGFMFGLAGAPFSDTQRQL